MISIAGFQVQDDRTLDRSTGEKWKEASHWWFFPFQLLPVALPHSCPWILSQSPEIYHAIHSHLTEIFTLLLFTELSEFSVMGMKTITYSSFYLQNWCRLDNYYLQLMITDLELLWHLSTRLRWPPVIPRRHYQKCYHCSFPYWRMTIALQSISIILCVLRKKNDTVFLKQDFASSAWLL